MNYLFLDHLATTRQATYRTEAEREQLVRAARTANGEDLEATRIHRLRDAIRSWLAGLGGQRGVGRPTATAGPA
jgi:hypothetical protein